MPILPLVIAPDPRLKTKSTPVEKFDAELKQLVADMFDTMYYEKGIGLSAVQIGVLKRVIVADVTWREEGGPGEQHVMINPEIIENADEPNLYKEGCLSFPDQFVDVTRPKAIKLRYQDVNGNAHEGSYDGLLATCIQHEIDHLNGVVLVDYASPVKRDMILRKLTKLKKAGAFDHHHHDHVHGEHCNHG